MATVTVPPEFFRGELRVYGNWREALARELLQNSCDANPTRINIQMYDRDGHGVVEFFDDGDGMTREVLEDVFFALGKTTKTGPDSVGGFGRARIITCFAQTSFRIQTGNLLVEGVGGEYTITETDNYVSGCVFTITLLDDDVSLVRNAFASLLARCSLSVPVYIDGHLTPGRIMPSRAVRVLRDTNGAEWAKVYVMGYGGGHVWTNVKGLNMFGRWAGDFHDVVVELNPARSREVLSASRDTLHSEFAEQLDEFVKALSQNRRKALRPPAEPLDVRVGGGGFIATDAAVNDTNTDSSPAGPGNGDLVRVTPGNLAAYTNLSMAPAPLDLLGTGSEGLAVDPPHARPLGFDVFMMADSADARVRKLQRAWSPTGWDETTGRRRRQLLMTWKAACQVSVDALVGLRPDLGRVMWTVGWVFDSDIAAAHKDQGGHVLALNPVDSAGRSRYRISERADRRTLLALALHEASHVAYTDHDERFSTLLTDLFASVDSSDADRIMRDAANK